jgi:AcrR family transcriptional regulator
MSFQGVQTSESYRRPVGAILYEFWIPAARAQTCTEQRLEQVVLSRALPPPARFLDACGQRHCCTLVQKYPAGYDADMISGSVADPPAGLRERAKLKRRALVQLTAMRLFAERGYDATTITDVAAAAEVSRRSVLLYFPSKADLALAWSNQVCERATAVFTARPDAGFVDLIDQWLRGERGQDPETARLAAAMYDRNPALRALGSAQLARAMHAGRAPLARVAGLPADDPRFAILGAAIHSAIDQYLHAIGRGLGTPALHDWFIDGLRRTLAAGPGAAPGEGHPPPSARLSAHF